MTKPQIFVIQSFSLVSDIVFEMIASAASRAGAVAFRADTIGAGMDIIQNVQEAIQKSPLIIADVSNSNPNVMYEVGFTQAQKKPLILMAESSRAIPIDLSGIQVVIYDLRSPMEAVDRLAEAIAQALKNPETFLYAEASKQRDKRQSVFISYSHRDREYLDRLLVHLKPLEKDGLIDLWIDTRLRPGDRWKKEIEKALSKANVAVLLVTADFLASDFITDNELPPLLRNAEGQGTRIIPLILKPCRFARDKNLKHFHAINNPHESLVLLPEGEQEMLYDSVAAEVERTLQRG